MPRRPPPIARTLLIGAGIAVACFLFLDWETPGLIASGQFGQAWERLLGFFDSFGHPDLSGSSLGRAGQLALQTLAVAVLGVILAIGLAWPLALGAARTVVGADGGPRRGIGGFAAAAMREGFRLLLDALRGVPDFAWALVIGAACGIGPATGILAIGLNVAGILGKVFSEQWDGVPPERYAALTSTGAHPLQRLLYGCQPLCGRGMLSFILMRTECAVRNASVIGVVGGGGLGGAIREELGYGNYPLAVTYLLAALALTLTVDLLANGLRYQLRTDPNHPRIGIDTSLAATRRRRRNAGVAIAVLVLASLWLVRDGLATAWRETARIDWGFIGNHYGRLLVPDLSPGTLWIAARESVVPLCIGFLATVASTVCAAALAFPASIAFQVHAHRFSGEALGTARRTLRWLLVVVARLVALLFRGVPEVAWVWILALLFRLGTEAGLLALFLHSVGVLARVFTETIDNVPYRDHEQAFRGGRFSTWLYSAVPRSWSDWVTYSFFQLEVNVRTGVVFGIIGGSGLGFVFKQSLEFDAPGSRTIHQAGTFLLTMVLLTAILDRLSRKIKAHRPGTM